MCIWGKDDHASILCIPCAMQALYVTVSCCPGAGHIMERTS